MNTIRIADTTLCRKDGAFGFKEKIEIARQLEKLKVDVIELPEIENVKTDILFVRTVSSFVKKATLSVAAGSTPESIENAAAALSHAENARIRIELPLSPVAMEYIAHKKPPVMLTYIAQCVTTAKEKGTEVEFCALDATRSEPDYLIKAIDAAVSAGADSISLVDSAAEMMPDDFAAFAAGIAEKVNVPVSVGCEDKNGLACASAILAVRAGIDNVKACVEGAGVPLEIFADMIKNCGNTYGFSCDIRVTELHRVVKQIRWIAQNVKNEKSAVTVASADEISSVCFPRQGITLSRLTNLASSINRKAKAISGLCLIRSARGKGYRLAEGILRAISGEPSLEPPFSEEEMTVTSNQLRFYAEKAPF